MGINTILAIFLIMAIIGAMFPLLIGCFILSIDETELKILTDCYDEVDTVVNWIEEYSTEFFTAVEVDIEKAWVVIDTNAKKDWNDTIGGIEKEWKSFYNELLGTWNDIVGPMKSAVNGINSIIAPVTSTVNSTINDIDNFF